MVFPPQTGDNAGELAEPPVVRLGGALRALRLAAGWPNVDEFCMRARLSRLRVNMVEGGHGLPDPATFHSYLDACSPPPAVRAALEGLLELARMEEPPEGDAETVVALAEGMVPADAAGETVTSTTMVVPASTTIVGRTPSTIALPLVSPGPEHGDQDVMELARMQGVVIAGRDVHVHTTTQETRTAVPQSNVNTWSLRKPAWSQKITVSQANPELWPDPATLISVEQFVSALLAIKNSTAMSFTALADATARLNFPLARSTLHAMCHKQKIPTNPQAVSSFIRAAGGSDQDEQRWVDAWQRLAQLDRSAPAAGPADELQAVGSEASAGPLTSAPRTASMSRRAPSHPLGWKAVLMLVLVLAVGMALGALLF